MGGVLLSGLRLAGRVLSFGGRRRLAAALGIIVGLGYVLAAVGRANAATLPNDLRNVAGPVAGPLTIAGPLALGTTRAGTFAVAVVLTIGLAVIIGIVRHGVRLWDSRVPRDRGTFRSDDGSACDCPRCSGLVRGDSGGPLFRMIP